MNDKWHRMWVRVLVLCTVLVGVFWAVTGNMISEWGKRTLWPETAALFAAPDTCFETRMADRERMARDKLTIVLARIGGDSQGRMTASLLRNLETAVEGTGMALHLFDCPVLVEGGVVADRRAEAGERAREWLGAIPGDAMIWGWAESDTRVTLRIVSPEDDRRDLYGLDDDLTLDPRFFADMAPLLVARASALAAPAYENGKYLVPLLQGVERRLAPLAANPPEWFGWEERGRLLHGLGTTLARLGDQTGNNDFLHRAIIIHLNVLKEWTRERVPHRWGAAQNNLGIALSMIGKRESETSRLNEAVAAYREALKEQTRERVPHYWASTQNNLGGALFALGELESGTSHLDKAVAAHREALKEWTRERVPRSWAGTQNNLGNALRLLGERESGTSRLDEAVTAYREALKGWTRDDVPLLWAMAHYNLGNALLRLGERESGTSRLNDAVAAYRESLKEYTRERMPLSWAKSTGNQGMTKVTLAERTGDVVLAAEAVEQIEAAMMIARDGKHAPLAASYEGQLSAAKALLARLRSETE